MRVLVTGATGQVGMELQKRAPSWAEVIAFRSADLDITDRSAVLECVERCRPQLIINAAAYTAVDRAETELVQAMAVNYRGPENLARAANEAGVPLFHLSTDYVFNGCSETAYTERAEPDPKTCYGRTKLMGELAVTENCSQHIILRTSWVFSAQGANFVKTMLRLATERELLRVVDDQRGGPTSAAAIADALWTLVWNYRSQQDAFGWGLYHFSGAPVVSWYEFCQYIITQAAKMQILTGRPRVEPICSKDYPTPAPRPQFSALDCNKIERQHGITQPDWRRDLVKVLGDLHAASESGC